MSDPFGERRTPWWRRIWRRGRPGSAPKQYTVPAGIVGPIAALLLPAVNGMDHTTKVVLGLALLALPPALVEIWWKQRQRRAVEQLLVFPEDQRGANNRLLG